MKVVEFCLGVFAACNTFAASNHEVRLAPAELPERTRTGESGLPGLTKVVLSESHLATNTVHRVDIVAWSLKTDAFEFPPRLWEQSVVLLSTRGIDRGQKWVLANARRMPEGAPIFGTWEIFKYPPGCWAPITNLVVFADKPSEPEIAAFIRATDFGWNEFRPGLFVAEVLLYHSFRNLRASLTEGISEEEKRRRYALECDCFLEPRRGTNANGVIH
jgi:hypothetical protein